jgi:hypothetical protein
MFSPTTTEINIDDKTTEYSNPQETVSATLSKVEEEQIAYNSTVSKVRVPSQNVK